MYFLHRFGHLVAALMILLGVSHAAGADQPVSTTTSHGLSLFGDLKYGADFKHFDYVNPAAPKGGFVRLHAIGTFDTLNPFVLRGLPASGLTLIYDSLLTGSYDEPSSEYGLLAESVEVPADFSWAAYTLRPDARWHDGAPVTVEDVIFTLELLKTKGLPFYRFYYANIVRAEKIGPRTVKFVFDQTGNRELPLITGQIFILPKHYWQDRAFDSAILEPPLGSGPYRISEVNSGRSVTYERVGDYWGQDLAVNRGRNNFGRIRYEYYRDQVIALEAFKARAYDFRLENAAKTWATQYDFPAVRTGLVIKQAIPHQNAAGMQGFVFNLRREKFHDPKLREALAYAFDFEWVNRNLFYGQYIRTRSYFDNSELASQGLPSPAEVALLEPYRGLLPARMFETPYAPPRTDGSGNVRANLRIARRLLIEAGWQIRDGVLTNDRTGAVLTIEVLLVSPDFERVVGPLIANLKKLGIEARMRTVDTAQYQNRIESFDFDMVVNSWGQSLSPGNEQREFWSTAAANRAGSRNLAGIKNPVIDAMIEKLIFASDRAGLIAATRALDRVLLWNHYVIPQWHINVFRVAHWNRFGRPAQAPPYNLAFPDTWWVDPDKDALLNAQIMPE